MVFAWSFAQLASTSRYDGVVALIHLAIAIVARRTLTSPDGTATFGEATMNLSVLLGFVNAVAHLAVGAYLLTSGRLAFRLAG